MAILIKFLYGIYEIVMAMRRKNEQFVAYTYYILDIYNIYILLN